MKRLGCQLDNLKKIAKTYAFVKPKAAIVRYGSLSFVFDEKGLEFDKYGLKSDEIETTFVEPFVF